MANGEEEEVPLKEALGFFVDQIENAIDASSEKVVGATESTKSFLGDKLTFTDSDQTLSEEITEAVMDFKGFMGEKFQGLMTSVGSLASNIGSLSTDVLEGAPIFDRVMGWLQTGIMTLFAGSSLWGLIKKSRVKIGQWFKTGFSKLWQGVKFGGGLFGWLTTILSVKDFLFGDSDAVGMVGWILDSMRVDDLAEYLFGFEDLSFEETFRSYFESAMRDTFGRGGVVGAIFGDELSKQINQGIEKPFKETWGYVSDTVGDLMVGDFKGAWKRAKKEWNELAGWMKTNVWTPVKNKWNSFEAWINKQIINPLRNIWSDTKSAFRTWTEDITRNLATMPGRLMDMFKNALPDSIAGFDVPFAMSDAEYFENRLQRQAEAGASAGTLDEITHKAVQDLEGEAQGRVLNTYNEILIDNDVGGEQRTERAQEILDSGAQNKFAGGGFIVEPIIGMGVESGESYSFGEGGMKEAVVPFEDQDHVTNILNETSPVRWLNETSPVDKGFGEGGMKEAVVPLEGRGDQDGSSPTPSQVNEQAGVQDSIESNFSKNNEKLDQMIEQLSVIAEKVGITLSQGSDLSNIGQNRDVPIELLAKGVY